MAEDNESFGDELVKLANIVEIIENSFIGNEFSEVEFKLSEEKMTYLSNNLNYQKKTNFKLNICQQ